MTVKIPSAAVCWWRIINTAIDLERHHVDTKRVWQAIHCGDLAAAREAADAAAKAIGLEH